ncbi:hypothetical protein yc1106_08985 [Curvularia clavata]|uniref:FAD-binding PCMH-type domain-containing protein n=1 Tax=Curvularia clavata TaxID=95742 RepID=A0A9Q9DXP1_CURCL|nr:hypothetical protein yc1106_08985 [Curvularia clavata]
MRSLLLAAFASFAVSQTFEASDFNVTEALIAQGVDVASLPGLSGLVGRSSKTACDIACRSLEQLYGNDTIEFQDEPGYSAFTSSFWSGIAVDVKPYCIYKPSSAAQVSVMVLLSRLSQCPFAVKSGGHSAFAGAATIEGGITMSFQNMKSIKLSEDKKIAAVQPGNTWAETLTALSTTGVTVVAGRVGDIGVGGLTLGGGISFLTNQYGLACDNVASYEVVTASGILVTATPQQYPDLYWALRGGGNNFGIVTTFHLMTKPLPNDLLWGGTRTYPEEAFPDVIKTWMDLGFNSPKDPKAGSWLAWLDTGVKLASTELWYAAPDGNESAILAPFYNITAISDTTKTRSHASYVKDNEANNQYGVREVYYVLSAKASVEIGKRAIDIFYKAVPKFASMEGAFPVLIWQHVTDGPLKSSLRNGGNAMGFDANGGPLIIIQVACTWRKAADDDQVYKLTSDILSAIKAESEALDKQSSWVYMNYASQFQDVIASYGEESKKKLKSVAAKYDPKEVFQKLQPGYFKLDRAPKPDARFFSH